MKTPSSTGSFVFGGGEGLNLMFLEVSTCPPAVSPGSSPHVEEYTAGLGALKPTLDKKPKCCLNGHSFHLRVNSKLERKQEQIMKYVELI